ncbi:MAG: hypothetical protein ABDH20_05350 [Thermus sp.]
MRTRLERWRNWPSFNEEATLLGLVLPLLQKAGYDPFNPEEVFPQGRDTNNLKPDLLLYKTSPLEGGQPHMVLEVKALGKPLASFQNQVVQYMNGVPTARWYILTNGEEWEVYDREKPLPLANCLVFRTRIGEPGGEEALILLLRKDHEVPPFLEAKRQIARATLEEAASRTSLEEQRRAYHITGEIAKPIRSALQSLSERFPDLLPELEAWEKAWRKKLENPREDPPNQATFRSWSEALYALGLKAYGKDPDRAARVLKILPPEYSGPLSNKPLPDGKRLCTNYSREAIQRLLHKLATEFPELKGTLTIGEETYSL